MDVQNLLKSLDSSICLSGGAVGSDLQWGAMAKKAGHSVIHWSFEKHETLAPPIEVVRLTSEQLNQADNYLIRANTSLKRRFPSGSILTNNLLRRNWYQVAWTDAVYATSSLDSNHTVKGGTAWACQLYMDRFIHDNEDMDKCKLYLFDINLCVWWKWVGKWHIMESAPTKPSGIWAGIGARKLNNAGKWEINKMFGGYPLTSQIISCIHPLVTVPKIGDIIYINDIKIKGKGIDNSIGGCAIIQTIQKSAEQTFVSVAELSGKYFSWDELKPQQEYLRDLYGMQHAQLKPDETKENNTEIEYYRVKQTTE
jgi:hypothetical protein